MVSLLKKLFGEESGTAAVEAAVALPVLLVLASGVLEMSNAVFDHQEIATGVRDAARFYARLRVVTPGDNPCNDNDPSGAKNLAVNGVITGGTGRVRGWKVGNVAIACAAVANPINAATGELTYNGSNPLYIITVSTAYPYQQLGLLGAFGLPSPTFNVVHSERWIGD